MAVIQKTQKRDGRGDLQRMKNSALNRKLRVLIITEDDPLYVIRFFDVFFKEYAREKIEICGITICRVFDESLIKTASRIWRFYGPISFLLLCLRFLKVKVARRSIAKLARGEGIREIECESVNNSEYLHKIRRIEPDVIMSVCAPEIFREELLRSAKLRCVNIHSGRLPTYRGMMPTFWQLRNGEPYATVTVHEMAERLDAGGVLRTLEFPLRQKDNLDRVMIGTKREGARLMNRVLLDIAAGKDQPEPVDLANAQYFSFPKPGDVRAFLERGHRFFGVGGYS